MRFAVRAMWCPPLLMSATTAALLMCVLLWLAFVAAPPAAAQDRERDDEVSVELTGAVFVNEVGNGRIRLAYRFVRQRDYDRIRRRYPNLYVLFRDFGINRADFEVTRDSLEVTPDDAERTITFRGDVLGVATHRNSRWTLAISRNERIIRRVGNQIFTASTARYPPDLLVSGAYEYRLPGSATILQYSEARQDLTYTLPAAAAGAAARVAPRVEVTLRYKPRILSSVYKVYADPRAGGGVYWVGKAVVKNVGAAPIYDLRIYYRLGEYTDESVAQKYSLVPARGAVVDVYYPIISQRVAQLRSRTPTELRVRYEYRDAAGKLYSDQLAERIEILGVNQFEFSNLAPDERTDSWLDDNNNAPLLAAFVMKNDEAVRRFAGIVSEAARGADASKTDGAKAWLKAAFEQQKANNVVYQTPAGFLSTNRAGDGGQEIKFPRDVFRDRSGTCVDLAITYASLAASVGLPTQLLVMEGHCFAMVTLPSGEVYRVENTVLGGGRDSRGTFNDALELGLKNYLRAIEDGRYFVVDIDRELGEGRVANPELPPLPTDFLEKLDIRKR